jgi:hypothetical protein
MNERCLAGTRHNARLEILEAILFCLKANPKGIRTLVLTAHPAFFTKILHQAPEDQVLRLVGTIIAFYLKCP